MGLVSMKCPSCGGDLNLETDSVRFFCPYCGTEIRNQSHVVHEEIHHIVDEAELRLLEEAKRNIEKDREKKKISGITCTVIVIAGIIVYAFKDKFEFSFSSPISILLMFLVAAAFRLFPAVISVIAGHASKKGKDYEDELNAEVERLRSKLNEQQANK